MKKINFKSTETYWAKNRVIELPMFKQSQWLNAPRNFIRFTVHKYLERSKVKKN